jgi:hypothetical protein
MVTRILANRAVHPRADCEVSSPTEGPGLFGKVPEGGNATEGKAVRWSRCWALCELWA